MAKRFYFCAVLGSGTEADPYRCWLQQQGIDLRVLDMRAYPQIEDGYMVAWGDISDANHALAKVEPSVTYLPFENASGALQPLSATLSNVSAANRAAIQAAFAAHGVPTTGITLAWTIAQVLQLMRRRMALGLMLEQYDFDEPSSLISAMPPLRIKAIRRALTNMGFDVAGITQSMTQGEAIAVLASQAIMDTHVTNIEGLAL